MNKESKTFANIKLPMFPKFPRGFFSNNSLNFSQEQFASESRICSRAKEPFLKLKHTI